MIRTQPEPRFDGMPTEAVELLRELRANNRKGWLARHRPRVHAHLRDPFLAYLRVATAALECAGHALRGDEGTVFKMQRDVRFSADKRPYHEHVEAVFSADGRRIGSRAAIHVRFGLDGGFLRAGSFLQPPESLRALREAMRARRARFLDLAHRLEASGCPLRADRSLKRHPKGFGDVEDAELGAWLRMVHPVAEKRLTLDQWTSARVTEETVKFASSCRAWLLFQSEALAGLDIAPVRRPASR